MQVFSRRFLRVGFLIFMTIALALSAQAAAFSKASLKGSYGFLINRWTANVNTSQFAVVGVMTFDGAGNVTASGTEIKGGVVQAGVLSGTYAVNSNGTGAINFTTGENPPQFAIALNSAAAGVARNVQLLVTGDNDNEVVSGVALLQSTTAETYSVASLKGNFTLQFNTWTADVNEAQNAAVGVIGLDGKGNLKGSATTMYLGVPYPTTIAGTYTVNSDGSGSMSLTTGPGGHGQLAFALNSVVAGQAKGLQFLGANTSGRGGNLVITGTALKQ